MQLRLLLIIFIGAGLFLSYVIARQILESLAPYRWKQTECLIQRSEVKYPSANESGCSYTLEYLYNVTGEPRTGTVWRLDPGVPDSSCHGWASLAAEFPPSRTTSCYFDPQNPAHVVLDRGNIFSVMSLILPLGMILIGILMLRTDKSDFSPDKTTVKRIAQGVATLVITGGTFLTFHSALLPIYKSWRSNSWRLSECVVLSSSLRTSSSSASTPGAATQNKGYYINIVYTYVVNGLNYVTDQYDFDFFGSGNAAALSRIVDRYPVNAKVSCSVNPENPYEAVLDAGFSAKYLWGFLPLGAVLSGLGLLIAVRRM